MQSLRREMDLREATRELDQAELALQARDYKARALELAEEQNAISEHTQSAVDDILDLPQGAQRFGKELGLLRAVVRVMDEAREILETPNAGGPAIAAETEAIELLLQTKRANPNGGGGGGGSPGGGSGAGRASAALANIGPGREENSSVAARGVGQATGRAGREYPEEFKTGLDAYFSNLEGGQED